MARPHSFLKHDDLPYRPCVGVMLINREGLVFVGRRIDQTMEGWQMPQGGIDAGETPEQAALRELKEEIGTNNAKILRAMDEWLAYDLPPHLLGVALHGKYRGQRQKWIAMRFEGDDSEIDIQTEEPEFAAWKWLAIEALPRLVVPFKRDTYSKVLAAFEDLAAPEY
ncbi:MAG TPA: RNA pyrophosphohydrolase [Rhizomicrobium sp.]|jgi:putative (di)nucleoside polyphosphate hydrolase|nr:RNA pyrophosphohydrolase [Rhizomicrobium sp.]